MDLNMSYYPETGDIAHDGIVPKIDLRIDVKLLHVGNREVDGFYHIGTRKLLPEDVSKDILTQLKTALMNAYHERIKDNKMQPCSVRIWPQQPLPSLSELRSLIGK